MVLGIDNYKYPTKEEWLKVSGNVPLIHSFGFPTVSEVSMLLEQKKSISEICINQNLYEWDRLLLNKIFNLNQSYINAMVNFNRGIAITSEDYKENSKVINLLQYELYCEMTFYYLISTRDIILQIINLAWELSLVESSTKRNITNKGIPLVTLPRVIDVLKGNEVLEVRTIVAKMETDLKKANDIRNSMNHSFSELSSDLRSSISEDGMSYSVGTGKKIPYTEQIVIMDEALVAMSNFIQSIREELLKKGFELDSVKG